jgi:hypothetical protein
MDFFLNEEGLGLDDIQMANRMDSGINLRMIQVKSLKVM